MCAEPTGKILPDTQGQWMPPPGALRKPPPSAPEDSGMERPALPKDGRGATWSRGSGESRRSHCWEPAPEPVGLPQSLWAMRPRFALDHPSSHLTGGPLCSSCLSMPPSPWPSCILFHTFGYQEKALGPEMLPGEGDPTTLAPKWAPGHSPSIRGHRAPASLMLLHTHRVVGKSCGPLRPPPHSPPSMAPLARSCP